jgi:hypothetical protein
MKAHNLLPSWSVNVPPILPETIKKHSSGKFLANDPMREWFCCSLENPKKRGQRWGWPVGSSSEYSYYTGLRA